jgi:hypothetical protein
MFVRCSVLALIVVFGFLTLVQAQSAFKIPDSGSDLAVSSSKVINGVNIRNHAITSRGDAITEATVLGWNFIHVDRCWMVLDGSTTWLYIFAQEGGGDDYYYTNSFFFQNMLTPACQNQNVVGFFVSDQNGLSWNQAITAPR